MFLCLSNCTENNLFTNVFPKSARVSIRAKKAEERFFCAVLKFKVASPDCFSHVPVEWVRFLEQRGAKVSNICASKTGLVISE